MAKSNYAELVVQAERAVKSVANAELRRVAFEKILDDLLKGPHGSPQQVEGRIQAPKRSHIQARPKAKRRGPHQYIEDMILDGFFKSPKTIAEVKAELENQGHHIAITSLSGPLQKLCQRRLLRRQRAKLEGKRQGFTYSEW